MRRLALLVVIMVVAGAAVARAEFYQWTDRDRMVLRDLAAATVTEVELRRTTREAVDLATRLEAALRGGKESTA